MPWVSFVRDNQQACLRAAAGEKGRITGLPTNKATERAYEYVQVWLLRDRLCYASVFNTQDTIHYIPLDRITVRPLPRGYKPRIGVQHVDTSLIALPEARAGNAAPEQPHGRVFSVQYGSRMVYWAADTSTEAKVTMIPIMHHHGRASTGCLIRGPFVQPAMQGRGITVTKINSTQLWDKRF